MEKTRRRSVIVFFVLSMLSASLVNANGTLISQEWKRKIEDLKSMSNEDIISTFKQETAMLKKMGYPLPNELEKTGYWRYFDKLSSKLISIPNLSEETVTDLLIYTTYYGYFPIMREMKKYLPILKNWAVGSDTTFPAKILREQAIRLLSFVASPRLDSDDIDPRPFQEANVSLSKKEKEEIKEILLKASYDTCVGIRITAVSGLLPYAKDEVVATRLRQLAKEDPKEYIRDIAQEILELGRIRSEVERDRLKKTK